MSDHEAIVELLQKAEGDATLREALQNTKTAEDVIQIAKTAGVTVTADNVRAFHQHLQAAAQQQAPHGELADAELEHVAGGSFLNDVGNVFRKPFKGLAGAATGAWDGFKNGSNL